MCEVIKMEMYSFPPAMQRGEKRRWDPVCVVFYSIFARNCLKSPFSPATCLSICPHFQFTGFINISPLKRPLPVEIVQRKAR